LKKWSHRYDQLEKIHVNEIVDSFMWLGEFQSIKAKIFKENGSE